MYTWSDVKSPQDRCAFCGCDNENVLERHHRIPSRFGGRDNDENLVTVCANCHSVLERIYNEDFWQRVKSLGTGTYQAELSEEAPTENSVDRSYSIEVDLDELASRIVAQDMVSDLQSSEGELDLQLLQWDYDITRYDAEILKKLIEREYRKENGEQIDTIQKRKEEKQTRDELIKAFYEHNGMTQKDVAECVDISTRRVRAILNEE